MTFGACRCVSGRFAAAATEGDLRSARELALRLMREAEDAGRVMEVGVANWWLGIIAFWHGDFAEGRARCELALSARDPLFDPEALERYGDFRRASFMPRRDLVAVGRGRTRAQIDRLGDQARVRGRSYWGACRCALLAIISGIMARRPFGNPQRVRGFGAARAGTRDGAVRQRGTQLSETRKIAAILVADVVGYSRLAGVDEDRTLARLRGVHSDLIDPAIARLISAGRRDAQPVM